VNLEMDVEAFAVSWVMVLVAGVVVVGAIELVIRFRRAAQTFDRIIDLSTPQERAPGPERAGFVVCRSCGDRVAVACDPGDGIVCIPAVSRRRHRHLDGVAGPRRPAFGSGGRGSPRE